MKPAGCSEEHVQAAIACVLDELCLRWWHTANEALQRGGPLYGCFLVGQGVKTGVLDITITTRAPAAWAAHYRGVDLEAKKIGGRLSADQVRWIEGLREDGHYADWFEGTHAGLALVARLGWDVDGALARLATRGVTIDASGRLVTDARQVREAAREVRVARENRAAGAPQGRR